MLKLTQETQRGLLAAKNGPGYESLLDVMEQMCVVEETELLRMDRSNGATGEQVLSKHDQCRAQRVLFERFQSEVGEQVKALIDYRAAEQAAKQAGQPSGEQEEQE